MNKLFIYIFLLTGVVSIQAQDYFSTLTPHENDTSERGSFSMNDKNYYIGKEAVYDSLGNDTFFQKIFEIEADGSLILIKNLGSLRLGSNNIVVDNDRLILSGHNDSSIWIKVYDDAFNELMSNEFVADNEGEVFFTTKMIAHDNDYFVVGASSGFQILETGQIFRISGDDLSVVNSRIIDTNINGVEVYDINATGQDSLMVMYAYQFDMNQPFDRISRFYTLDGNLEIIDSLDSEVKSGYSFGSFMVLENERIAIHYATNNDLQVINADGSILWELSVEDEFSELDYPTSSATRELKVDDNGDLIISGSLAIYNNELNYDLVSGFGMKITEDGEVLWKRIFTEKLNDQKLIGTLNSILVVDDGIIFTGFTGIYIVQGLGNNGWVLKTDHEGCVFQDCGLEQVLNVKKSAVFSNVGNLIDLGQNPISSQLSVMILQDDLDLVVINAHGQIVALHRNLSKGLFVITENLPPGIINVIVTKGKGERQIERMTVIH